MKDEYIIKSDALDAISCDITITGKKNAEIVCKAIASFADGIKALPTADVVPVVRCKNCIYSVKSGGYQGKYMCNNENAIDDYVKSDDFCSYGEREDY